MLLCMNSIKYLLLTTYALIILLKVLSHLVMKIKSFVKYLKRGIAIFEKNREMFNYFKVE